MNSRHPFRAIGSEPSQADSLGEHEAEQPPLEHDAAAMDEEITVPNETWSEGGFAVHAAPEPFLTRFMPLFTIALIAMWTAFFLYAHSSRLSGEATAIDAVNLVRDWALPVVLIALAWLLIMRSSAREAHRFGNVSAQLEQQTRVLEDRLTTVNRELGLAREFLTAEARELDFLGRSASERISEHAGYLQDLIRHNGTQVDAIAGVSATALDNMNRLRQDLPVVAASARDITNQIANAGRSASEQIGQLTAEFDRMYQAGQANEEQIEALKGRTGDAIEAARSDVEALVVLTEQRLGSLREGTDEFRRIMSVQEEEAFAAVKARTILLGRELAAYHARLAEEEDAQLAHVEQRLAATRDEIAALHTRIGEEAEQADQAGQRRLDALRNSMGALLAEIEQLERQADAGSTQRLGAIREAVGELDSALAKREIRFVDGLTERRRDWDDTEEAAIARLAERMAALDADLAARRKQEIAQTLMLTEHSEAIAERMDTAAARVDDVVAKTRTAQDSLDTGIEGLTQRLGEARELIDEADMALGSVSEASVRVLDLLRDGASHAQSDLRGAVADALAQLELADARGMALAAALGDAGMQSGHLRDALDAMAERGTATATMLDTLRNSVTATEHQQAMQLARLHEEFASFEEHYTQTTEKLALSLRQVIDGARDDLAAAFAAQTDGQDERIAALAARAAEQSAAVIDAALAESGLKTADEVGKKMQEVAATGNDAVVELRNQLGRIHELTSNLEARIARAREQSEENVDNDFSRRVAMITEQLNSTAIDLDKFLATEVSETAWTSYLKGDRGIFTRKAVRLLDNREAREIAELYNSDGDFRAHVNRYVHDFEAMLRSLLSTRNGNTLSVTILSSDMGKLYVALAQAIERLRQ